MNSPSLFNPPAASAGAIRLDMVSSGLASKFSPALPPGGLEFGSVSSPRDRSSQTSASPLRESSTVVRRRLSGSFVHSRWFGPTPAH